MSDQHTTTYLLDTNVISHAIRGGDGNRERLRRMPQACLRIPVVALAELEYGSLKSPDPSQNRQRWRRLVDGLGVLHFDEPAAIAHARLRLELAQQPIGERDLLIAAIAVSHGLTMVTGNIREFHRVRGLRVVDWTG